MLVILYTEATTTTAYNNTTTTTRIRTRSSSTTTTTELLTLIKAMSSAFYVNTIAWIVSFVGAVLFVGSLWIVARALNEKRKLLLLRNNDDGVKQVAMRHQPALASPPSLQSSPSPRWMRP